MNNLKQCFECFSYGEVFVHNDSLYIKIVSIIDCNDFIYNAVDITTGDVLYIADDVECDVISASLTFKYKKRGLL